MPGPPAAVAAVRVAVRRALERHRLTGRHVVVGCSGGADSLALAAGVAFEAPRAGGSAGAVVVDHGLQPGSDRVAAQAAAQCLGMGLDPVQVVAVSVAAEASGPEDAARRARLAALCQVAQEWGATALLLGHTRDDQAEQVLLGLARGSGTRSLSGMPSVRATGEGPPVLLVRPLLALSRVTTEQACRDQGLRPWHDPHNADPRFARVRARAALRLLEEALGPGLAAALARTADLLRDDADALDELALTAYRRLGDPPWAVTALAGLAPAVRRRVWRAAAVRAGSPPGALTDTHLRAADALVTDWHGQGPIDLPGHVHAARSQGRVWLRAAPPS